MQPIYKNKFTNLINTNTWYRPNIVPFLVRNFNTVKIPWLNNRLPNIVRVIKFRRLRWAGYVARMEEGRSAFKILTGKPTGKRSSERPRRRWEHNIRVDLKYISIREIGLTRLRVGIIWEPLWMRHWTSGFHKPCN